MLQCTIAIAFRLDFDWLLASYTYQVPMYVLGPTQDVRRQRTT